MKSKGKEQKIHDRAGFTRERERLNKIVMKYAGPGIRRFYGLDHQAFLSGALPAKTKELIGLVASLVLRCDDCIRYHLQQCAKQGLSDPELTEALNIGLLIGGSITIPHLRRAFEFWDEIQRSNKHKYKADSL